MEKSDVPEVPNAPDEYPHVPNEVPVIPRPLEPSFPETPEPEPLHIPEPNTDNN